MTAEMAIDRSKHAGLAHVGDFPFAVAWEQATKLGVAVKRREPWHVRAAHDDELRQLNKRFTDAIDSSW
jgi:hypothetical protein